MTDTKSTRVFNEYQGLIVEGLVLQTREELLNSMQEHWQEIEQDSIDNLIKSMPNGCRTVLNNRGGLRLS